jgi:hypothetical protein
MGSPNLWWQGKGAQGAIVTDYALMRVAGVDTTGHRLSHAAACNFNDGVGVAGITTSGAFPPGWW